MEAIAGSCFHLRAMAAHLVGQGYRLKLPITLRSSGLRNVDRIDGPRLCTNCYGFVIYCCRSRPAGINQVTSGLLSPVNSDPILKPGRQPKPCDDFRRFNVNSADTDRVSDLSPDECSREISLAGKIE